MILQGTHGSFRRHPSRVPGLVFAIVLACSFMAAGKARADLPVPPCTGESVVPPHAEVPDADPNWIIAMVGEGLQNWNPPECLGWRKAPRDVLIALAGRIEVEGADALLVRFARVSALEDIRYWSVTRESWRKVFSRARALSKPDMEAVRPDFALDELREGTTFYSVTDDNEPTGPVVNALTIRERSPDRLVLEMRNISSSKLLGAAVLPPGGMITTFIAERERSAGAGDGEIWRLYAISGITADVPGWLLPPPAAYLNRAIAFYRFVADVPSDREPPPIRRSIGKQRSG